MERGFYNEDFEQLIKQKADQYKMFPSDHVWKNIDRSMHTRRKWYWLGFLLFLAGVGYYSMVELMSPANRKTAVKPEAAPLRMVAAQNNTAEKAIIVPFSTAAAKTHKHVVAIPAGWNTVSDDTDPSAIEAALVPSHPALLTAEEVSAISKETPVYDQQTGSLKKEGTTTLLSHQLSSIVTSRQHYQLLQDILSHNRNAVDAATHLSASITPDPDKKLAAADETSEDMKRINWLQENAVYELRPPPMKRIGWQVAFSPTMNYRRLTMDPNTNYYGKGSPGYVTIKNVPVAMNLSEGPDKLVNHKPALGFELGTHILYTVNKNIRLRAGIQFNYSRYDIQAYSAPTPEEGTIGLDNSGGRRTVDSITNYTSLRNFGGDDVKELRNQYFQLAAPVGLEIRLLGSGKLQLNAAGTIQPTYLLNRNTYLITTDYKNYMREPSLVRRWNVNTAAELFVSYKTGGVTWQAGPQFRYQLLSSYVKEYPIREYLMEYGIKVGVTKTIR